MQRKASQQQKLMKNLFIAMGVLIVMLIAVLVIIVTGAGSTEQQTIRVVESGKFVKGVTVAGVDVSGFTYDEAAAKDQIKQKAVAAATSFKYTFTVQDKKYTYTAADMGLKADVDKTLTDAMKWGNVGDGDTKTKQQDEALKSGKNFDIVFDADADALKSFLKQHKTSEYDSLPKNATVKVKDASANPPFEFVQEENGVDVDVNKLAQMISDNINKEDYSSVEAPVLITPPTLDLKTLKANFSNDPIATYTSKFNTSHLSVPNRVNNIKIMGSFVNGTVIEPGQTWSLNDTAGPRDATTAKTIGWTMAPGLQDGTAVDQWGGGVCQISSTTYNAAILAELNIVERYPHSWKSDYIPEGMDATVTTGLKDLKLANPYNYPVLFVCIVDTTAKTATVNVYGPPMKYTVKFTTKLIKNVQPGATQYYYNQTETPDGTPIPPNTAVEYVSPKNNRVLEVYKQHFDKDGNPVDKPQLFTTTTYPAYPAEYYCNYPKTGPVATAPPA